MNAVPVFVTKGQDVVCVFEEFGVCAFRIDEEALGLAHFVFDVITLGWSCDDWRDEGEGEHRVLERPDTLCQGGGVGEEVFVDEIEEDGGGVCHDSENLVRVGAESGTAFFLREDGVELSEQDDGGDLAGIEIHISTGGSWVGLGDFKAYGGG